MPDDSDSARYDTFLTMVACWNLYGLPVLLVLVAVVVVAVVVLARRGARHAKGAGPVDGPLAVRRIGLIHYGLTLRAGIFLVQELLTMRTMGIPQSLAILIPSAIGVVINPLLGLGLRRRPPRTRTRRWAIAWYTLLSLIAIGTTFWIWYYHAAVDPARWPDDLVSLGLPVFLWVVMLLPRTRRAFVAKVESTNPSDPDREPAQLPPAWPWVSLPVLLFLIVLSSTVAVEAVDWAYRMATEPGELP